MDDLDNKIRNAFLMTKNELPDSYIEKVNEALEKAKYDDSKDLYNIKKYVAIFVACIITFSGIVYAGAKLYSDVWKIPEKFNYEEDVYISEEEMSKVISEDKIKEIALNKLNELGYIVNTNELDKIDSVTKAHIANDIINNEKNRDLLIKNFNCIPNKGEFIETLLNENCPCYVEKLSITPYVASCMIKKYGGKVILAHPVAYYYEDKKSEEDIMELVKEMNADGIEGNYIYVDRNNIKHNDIVKWNNLANKLNIISTAGSDFHNFDNIHPVIGLLNEDININTKEIINNLEK